VGSILLALLPVIIGAAVVPTWIIMVLLLLRGQGGHFQAMHPPPFSFDTQNYSLSVLPNVDFSQ
jgi:hypothetical protein